MFAILSTAIGGLGLFLLGMWLMSDGLKSAAGSTLHHLLHHWTRSRIRGLAVGFLLTAMVQSSSAVTVATIGFTDAGLLKLKRAVWVIFGSNVGTTVTGWLVALIGFNVNISQFALPMVGIGMFVKLIYRDRQMAFLGQALLGFGVLFMGIDVLKDTFSGLDQQITLTAATTASVSDILIYTGIGFLLTMLMQSSSVTLAITLTALSGGFIGLAPAAAMVIGSNLGTTSTAVFSALGSGPAAKRVVASHVLFNLLTAVISLLLLVPLLTVIIWLQSQFAESPAATTTLALFHTSFNLIGVILMWPLARPMVQWLKTRFVSQQEDESKTLYLKKQALSVPSLATHALKKELQRLSQYVLSMARDSINGSVSGHELTMQRQAVSHRLLEIGNYSSQIYKQPLSASISDQLPVMLRVSRYFDTIAGLAAQMKISLLQKQLPEELQQALEQYNNHSLSLIAVADIDSQIRPDSDKLEQELLQMENHYQELKRLLLKRGSEGQLAIPLMAQTLAFSSDLRRINQQAVKACLHFLSVDVSDKNLADSEAVSVETTTSV